MLGSPPARWFGRVACSARRDGFRGGRGDRGGVGPALLVGDSEVALTCGEVGEQAGRRSTGTATWRATFTRSARSVAARFRSPRRSPTTIVPTDRPWWMRGMTCVRSGRVPCSQARWEAAPSPVVMATYGRRRVLSSDSAISGSTWPGGSRLRAAPRERPRRVPGHLDLRREDGPHRAVRGPGPGNATATIAVAGSTATAPVLPTVAPPTATTTANTQRRIVVTDRYTMALLTVARMSRNSPLCDRSSDRGAQREEHEARITHPAICRQGRRYRREPERRWSAAARGRRVSLGAARRHRGGPGGWFDDCGDGDHRQRVVEEHPRSFERGRDRRGWRCRTPGNRHRHRRCQRDTPSSTADSQRPPAPQPLWR